MRAGPLRERLTLQSVEAGSQDDYGGSPESVSTFATVWGAVEPLRGVEMWKAQEVNPEISYRVRIRYRSGVVPTMRVITEDSKTLEVVSVVDLGERHRQMHLMCREWVNR